MPGYRLRHSNPILYKADARPGRAPQGPQATQCGDDKSQENAYCYRDRKISPGYFTTGSNCQQIQ